MKRTIFAPSWQNLHPEAGNVSIRQEYHWSLFSLNLSLPEPDGLADTSLPPVFHIPTPALIVPHGLMIAELSIFQGVLTRGNRGKKRGVARI
jgi:hypothetical protein